MAAKTLARLRALDYARAEIKAGVRENPPNSNWSPRIAQYLESAGLHYQRPPGAPWCMAAVHWCFARAGVTLGGWASVGRFEEWAHQQHSYEFPTRPLKGDIVCYRFDSDDWPDHVGIVDRVLALKKGGRPYLIRVAEGNTAIGNDANGGRYMLRTRWAWRCRYVRVA